MMIPDPDDVTVLLLDDDEINVEIDYEIDPDVIAIEMEGQQGASVYGVWLAAGHTGTIDDFLASLIGPPGRDGSSLGDLSIEQPSPASVWTLAHNLNRFPTVTLVDSAGDEFDGDKRYVDANTIVVTLNAPTSGAAYLR